MSPRVYKLIDRVPVPCADFLEWASWFEHAARQVGRDDFGNVCVSTIFIGLDHSYSETGPPLLFETMVFGGVHDGYQRRTSTWELAVIQHREVVALVAPYEVH